MCVLGAGSVVGGGEVGVSGGVWDAIGYIVMFWGTGEMRGFLGSEWCPSWR